MPKLRWENTKNNNQGNMSPPELSYPTTASLEYSSTASAPENDLKTNYRLMKEFLKKEMKNSLKDIEENKANIRGNLKIP